MRFYELAGDGAAARLTDLARAFDAAGAATELLRSRDDPGLWLLVVRGAGGEPAPPAGARVWRFESGGGGRDGA